MSISTLSGISYILHSPLSSNPNSETPHVHVIYEGKCVSISLKDVSFISGEEYFEKNTKQKILNWVSSNLVTLKSEWDSKRKEKQNYVEQPLKC